MLLQHVTNDAFFFLKRGGESFSIHNPSQKMYISEVYHWVFWFIYFLNLDT